MRLILAAALAAVADASARDTFHESLTLHPLPDGKLSVLFEFTTQFSLHHGDGIRTSPWAVASSLTDRPEPPRAHAAGPPPPARAQ